MALWVNRRGVEFWTGVLEISDTDKYDINGAYSNRVAGEVREKDRQLVEAEFYTMYT
jgi:hypothetical protein